MNIEEPHGPPHESSSFWYDTEQKTLLFEVIFRDNGFTPEADHSHGQAERAKRGNHWHDHLNPHGMKLADSSPTDSQGNDATRNIELVIRLWNQVISGDQMGRPEWSQRFLPVPATLALFLNGRRDQMSMSSVRVRTNWPAKMSHSPHGECDIDAKRTDESPGFEQPAKLKPR